MDAAAKREANEAMEEEIRAQVALKPLVGPREAGLASLEAEFRGAEAFASKLPALARKYGGVRRVRGDGNCFFRGFMFRYLEIVRADARERERVLAVVKGALEKLLAVGYERVSIETFCEFAEETLEGLGEKSQADLEALFGDEGESDYLVWFARLACAGFLKSHPDQFLPFLPDNYVSMDEFCAKEVEPMGYECEQPQIIALCGFLQVSVVVEYLDQSAGESATAHTFSPTGHDQALPAHTVCLLYRPGHYDVLYPLGSEAAAA